MQVEIGECLYHAIDFGFYNVVDLFVRHHDATCQVITDEDSYYPAGIFSASMLKNPKTADRNKLRCKTLNNQMIDVFYDILKGIRTSTFGVNVSSPRIYTLLELLYQVILPCFPRCNSDKLIK